MSDTNMGTSERVADSGSPASGPKGRALTRAEFAARGKAFRFPKGQSGNPDGQARFYHECRKIAREASPEMMAGLIDLAKNAEDERVRSVCLVAVLDRAGIKPIDYDPAIDEAAERPKFNPRLYTPAQLARIKAALEIMVAVQGGGEGAELMLGDPRAGARVE